MGYQIDSKSCSKTNDVPFLHHKDVIRKIIVSPTCQVHEAFLILEIVHHEVRTKKIFYDD